MGIRAHYFDEINLLRAFAVLAVISIHTSGCFIEMHSIRLLTDLYMAVDFFSQYAVPLFICISGFVLYNKYSEPFPLAPFYHKRLTSILPPYLVFSTFYLAVTAIGSAALSRPVTLAPPQILFRYLTGESFYHLWFMILIIQFYLLYPALLRLYRSCAERGWVAGLLLASLVVCVVYKEWLIVDRFGITSPTSVLGVSTKFVGYLFYFFLGMIIRSRYERLPPLSAAGRSLSVLSAPLLVGTLIGILYFTREHFLLEMPPSLLGSAAFWSWLVAAMIPLYYLVIFAVGLRLSQAMIAANSPGRRTLERIGHDSFGIYLVHAFFLNGIILGFSRFGFDQNDWLFYPATFLLTLALSLLSVEALQKVPFSRHIIGSTR